MTDTPLHRRRFLALASLGTAGVALVGCGRQAEAAAERFVVTKTDAQWRQQLGPAAYDVLRHEGTERPFTSPLNDEHRAGTFTCKGCAAPLFSSRFYAPLRDAVATRTDRSLGMARVEVHCRRCGGHLGHVFDDGPPPTGKRYCMNGVAMTFRTG